MLAPNSPGTCVVCHRATATFVYRWSTARCVRAGSLRRMSPASFTLAISVGSSLIRSSLGCMPSTFRKSRTSSNARIDQHPCDQVSSERCIFQSGERRKELSPACNLRKSCIRSMLLRSLSCWRSGSSSDGSGRSAGVMSSSSSLFARSHSPLRMHRSSSRSSLGPAPRRRTWERLEALETLAHTQVCASRNHLSTTSRSCCSRCAMMSTVNVHTLATLMKGSCCDASGGLV
mmetsp:Transcript_1972/g.3160  ORF Transcript_1972/g.3160 Transcript_1972/m.3160 type:complete len:232 (-) Transcript_1972:653-1348(-)